MTRNISILMLALALAAARIARAQDTNSADASAQTGFQSFQIIAQKNIFDPYRRPRVGSVTAAPPTYYFTLNGTMSYEDKSYAFFDGSGIRGGRAFQPSDSINGYKIAEIADNYVKLMASSNQFVKLTVGMQMKRTGTGPWALVAGPDPTAEPSAPSESGSGRAMESMVGGADSDVMKRLMARRAQETGDSKSNSNSTTNENNQ